MFWQIYTHMFLFHTLWEVLFMASFYTLLNSLNYLQWFYFSFLPMVFSFIHTLNKTCPLNPGCPQSVSGGLASLLQSETQTEMETGSQRLQACRFMELADMWTSCMRTCVKFVTADWSSMGSGASQREDSGKSTPLDRQEVVYSSPWNSNVLNKKLVIWSLLYLFKLSLKSQCCQMCLGDFIL